MKQKRSMTTMTMKMKPDMTTKRNFTDTNAGHNHAAGEAGHSDEIVISPEKAAAVGIATETVAPGRFREVIHTSGEILPAAGDESTIVATTDGTVTFAENYTEGMAVGQDQEIFAILSGNLQDGNRIEKARIAYLTAKEEYERASKLTDSRIVSQKEFVKPSNRANPATVWQSRPRSKGSSRIWR